MYWLMSVEKVAGPNEEGVRLTAARLEFHDVQRVGIEMGKVRTAGVRGGWVNAG